MEVHRISREISPSSMHITCPWPCQGAPWGRVGKGMVCENGGYANQKVENENESGIDCFTFSHSSSVYLFPTLPLFLFPVPLSTQICTSTLSHFPLPYSLAAAESSLSCSSSPTTSLSSLSSLAGKWNRAMRRPPRLLSHLCGEGSEREGEGGRGAIKIEVASKEDWV